MDAGWNFGEIWGIHPSINNGYPYLRVFYPATFSIDIEAFDFGTIAIGQTSAAQTFTITNTGTGPLYIEEIAIDGENQDEFNLIATGLPWTIEAGDTRTFTVSFSPTDTESRMAYLSISHTTEGSPSMVLLEGTGHNPPAFSIDHESHDFGSVLIGQSSDFQTFTITNTGGSPLTIHSISFAGANANNFIHAATGLPWEIAAGGSRSINITFTPQLPTGIKLANLVIEDDLSRSIEYSIASNRGNTTDLVIDENSRRILSNSVGTSETISTTMVGVWTEASSAATIGRLGNHPYEGGNRAIHTITLSGIATMESPLQVFPSSHDFGRVDALEISDTQNFILLNSGANTMIINTITISGENASDFRLVGVSGMPWAIPSQGTREFQAVFEPKTGGFKTADIIVSDNVNAPIMLSVMTDQFNVTRLERVTARVTPTVGRTFVDPPTMNGAFSYNEDENIFIQSDRALHGIRLTGIGVGLNSPESLVAVVENNSDVILSWQSGELRGGMVMNSSGSSSANVSVMRNRTAMSGRINQSESENTRNQSEIGATRSQSEIGTTESGDTEILSFTFLGYHVYRDGLSLTDTPILEEYYTDFGVNAGRYVYSVRAVYDSGESDATEIDVNVLKINIDLSTPALIGESLSISGKIEHVRAGTHNVRLIYFKENDSEITQTVTTSDGSFDFTIPAEVNTEGALVNFFIEIIHAGSVFTSPVIKYIAGNTEIAQIRSNILFYEGVYVRLRGIAITSQGDISDNVENDFIIQDRGNGIRVIGGVSVNAMQNYEYIVEGIVSRNDDGIVYLLSTGLLQQLGLQPEPRPTLIRTPVGQKEELLYSFIGIPNVSLKAGESWHNVRRSNGLSSVVAEYQYGEIIIKYMPDNFTLFTEALHFDITGVLCADIDGYYLIIRSDNDFYPLGVLSVSISEFNAISNGNIGIDIHWTAETETNMLGYKILRAETNDIERAIYATNDFIEAHNQTFTQNYSFTDREVIKSVEYYYWLQAIEFDGVTETFGPISVVFEEPEDDTNISMSFMSPVYPNPFHIGSVASFDVTVKMNETAELRIYNIRGQLIRSFNNLQSGKHSLSWDGKDSIGNEVSSGIYFYRLTSPSRVEVRRMVVIK